MNLVETHDLLRLIKAYDNRNFDDAAVIAWYPLMADLVAEDARAAVTRHFGTSEAYLMPVHVRDGVRAIRNERAQAEPHEVRALPSRFEADDVRDDRVRRGLRELAGLWSVPEENAATGSVMDRALERARRERKGRQAIPSRPRRHTGGPGVELDKVTTGPEWSDPKARERASIDALHAAGRGCGRVHCPRCNTQDRES